LRNVGILRISEIDTTGNKRSHVGHHHIVLTK
jgi:hypothetical protein